MKKATVTGIALALMTSTSAIAQTATQDLSSPTASADKISDIRPTIDYIQHEREVTRKRILKNMASANWIPDKLQKVESTEDNLLQQLAKVLPNVDYTVTGSINGVRAKSRRKLVWEKFDTDGNLID